MEIAVIIPYFQRENGILARALRSVEQQDIAESVRVYVVDDGSPAPASSELATLGPNPRFPIELIVQRNGGPGDARNRALSQLAPRTTHVAFLDSDDEWLNDHLANALTALAAGFDVFFANFTHLDQTAGAFERAGRIRAGEHPAIAGKAFLHAYQGDMLSQVATGNVIGTSTIVFDAGRFPDVRFRPEFRNAGEDYLFWIELASRGARFAFSDRIEVRYGRGVNVYSGSGWGTEMHLSRLINELRYCKVSRKEYALPPAARQRLREREVQLRLGIVRDVMHRLRHRRFAPWPWIVDLVRTDPMILIAAFPAAIRIVLARTP